LRTRAVPLLIAPVAAYAIVRSLVSSDALALAVATAFAVLYSIALALIQRRVDLLAALSVVGFSLACVASVLSGGSALPLKLGEAPMTFGIGLVLIIAPLVQRPLPLGRLLRVPFPDRQIDGTLGAIVGSFLVLHAVLHFALAVSLSTSSYLVVGRIIDLGAVALGVLGLSAYRRTLATRRGGNAPVAS
jgi:hypothetical protein